MTSVLRVRNSAKAIIFDRVTKKLLLIEHLGQDGTYFTFPGGGQEHGENLVEAVVRECIEEIGTSVEVDKLVFVRDYVARNHEFAKDHPDFHEVEFYFLCSLETSSNAKMGATPDKTQIGIRWIPVSEVPESPIYPKTLRPLLRSIMDGGNLPVYLGDVN